MRKPRKHIRTELPAGKYHLVYRKPTKHTISRWSGKFLPSGHPAHTRNMEKVRCFDTAAEAYEEAGLHPLMSDHRVVRTDPPMLDKDGFVHGWWCTEGPFHPKEFSNWLETVKPHSSPMPFNPGYQDLDI